MSKRYARVDGETVVEIAVLDVRPEKAFHPEIAALFKVCDSDVEPGWSFGENGFVPPTPYDPPLAKVKASFRDAVDKLAETERIKYITAGSGQALTYMQKSDEARRYLSSESPDGADYPLLSSEVGITASNLDAVASIIAAAYAQWQQVGAAIEAARLGGKAAINAAGNKAEMQAAFDAISWPEL